MNAGTTHRTPDLITTAAEAAATATPTPAASSTTGRTGRCGPPPPHRNANYTLKTPKNAKTAESEPATGHPEGSLSVVEMTQRPIGATKTATPTIRPVISTPLDDRSGATDEAFAGFGAFNADFYYYNNIYITAAAAAAAASPVRAAPRGRPIAATPNAAATATANAANLHNNNTNTYILTPYRHLLGGGTHPTPPTTASTINKKIFKTQTKEVEM